MKSVFKICNKEKFIFKITSIELNVDKTTLKV